MNMPSLTECGVLVVHIIVQNTCEVYWAFAVDLVLQGVVVVYNLDPDTTEEQLVWIFSRFGDVKDIQQAPMRSNQKFIEFWDVRHAAAALRAMNRAELSRLPAPGPSLSAGAAAVGGSSSGLAGLMGQEQDAAGGLRAKGLSGDGSAARTGDGGASSSSHAYAAAQVAAAMQQLEMEQQQQQQQQLPFQRSQGQPIPRPPSNDPQMQLAMQHADTLQQQVAQRGMVRPVSGMLDRMHAAVSPPLSLGPLSQSWDTSGNPGSLVGMLNRQQQQQGQQQHGQQQQQQQQSLLQQQQQQILLQQLASGLLRGSRTDLSGLVRMRVT
jgi:RNA recognition motif-containing protein